jgi:hypothetical protein
VNRYANLIRQLSKFNEDLKQAMSYITCQDPEYSASGHLSLLPDDTPGTIIENVASDVGKELNEFLDAWPIIRHMDWSFILDTQGKQMNHPNFSSSLTNIQLISMIP